MKSQAGRWILFLSVLTAVIGCRAFGVASAAAKDGENNQAGTRPLIPPLVAEAPREGAADAPQRAESPPPEAPPPARTTEPPPPKPEPPQPKVARPTESIPMDGCVTSACHPGIKAQPFTHGPVGADSCDACHAEADPSKHTFELSETGGELCESCHELELEEKHIHQPVKDGQCDQCHDPHGGQDRFLLRGDSVAATCAECHDDITEDLPFVHGPVAAGACTGCHRAHSSDHPSLLTRAGRDLCLDCHLTLKKRLDAVRTVHGPVATDCVTCHLPHAGEHKMLLTEELKDLCLGCHSDIEDLIADATVKHDAVTTGRACRNCHDPHGSDYSAMLVNDAFDVCLSCHDRQIELTDGTSLMSMQGVLAEGLSRHGPVEQRNCEACHQVHGGSHFRLLIEEYPAAFYAPYREETYALCFSCHDSELVRDPKTRSLTNFRNGEQNLHYLHVNKETKGRTCRACHETHASSKPRHIRDAVPFGSSGWMLPINFEKTDTGGRCSPGCHRPYDYDRLRPVSNTTLEPPSASIDATTVSPDRQKE